MLYLLKTVLFTSKIINTSISRSRDHLQSKNETVKLQQKDKSFCCCQGDYTKITISFKVLVLLTALGNLVTVDIVLCKVPQKFSVFTYCYGNCFNSCCGCLSFSAWSAICKLFLIDSLRHKVVQGILHNK